MGVSPRPIPVHAGPVRWSFSPWALPALVLLSGCPSAEPGPCPVDIPADARLVQGELDAADGVTYWVCEGGELTVDAGDVIVIVEPGGAAHANSGTWDLYVQAGGVLVVDAGEGRLFVEDGAAATVNTTAVDVQECRPIELDRSEAPEPGC